jgi:hypothetical protein
LVPEVRNFSPEFGLDGLEGGRLVFLFVDEIN